MLKLFKHVKYNLFDNNFKKHAYTEKNGVETISTQKLLVNLTMNYKEATSNTLN